MRIFICFLKEEPFVILKESDEILTGNDRYEGFCIDLLHEIALLKKFNYTIHEVYDNTYGVKDANNKWSGMIGELIDKVRVILHKHIQSMRWWIIFSLPILYPYYYFLISSQ